MGFLIPSFIKMPTDVSRPLHRENPGPYQVSGSTQRAEQPMVRGMPELYETDDPRVIIRSRQNPIGVLHVINGEHFSGAERVQQLLGKRLPEQCIDPYFVCLKDGKFPQMCGLERDRVSVISMRSRADFSILGRIKELALDRRIDLIHAHTPRSAMIASLVARKLDIPWVFHVHSPTARDSTRSWLNRINDTIERISLSRCDHIITVSKSLRREMLSRGYPRTKVTCVANGVASQEPIDPFARINRDDWKLGMVALVRPRKGIEILLEALAGVREVNSNVTLDVIGPFETSAYENEVHRLVDQLGLQKVVQFLGFTKDVPNAIRSLDAMVLPSLFGEGMPMVVLEALALGVPVIATKVEGTPEVVRDGIEGYLAEARNADSLAQAILRFISSRSAWTGMSERAFQRHQAKFSDDDMALKTAKVYRKVLGIFAS